MSSHTAAAVPPPPSRSRLRLVPAPQPSVPYDDERTDPAPRYDGSRSRVSSSSAGTQGTLALAFSLPSGVPAVPTPSPQLRVLNREVVKNGRRLGVINGGGPDGSTRDANEGGRADAGRWASLIAQAIVEAEVGDRPMSQLVRWTTDEVYAAVAARCKTHGRRNATARRAISRAMVASVHICHITDDVVEACATVRRDGRARAVAMRLERVLNGWRCTAVSLG